MQKFNTKILTTEKDYVKLSKEDAGINFYQLIVYKNENNLLIFINLKYETDKIFYSIYYYIFFFIYLKLLGLKLASNLSE